MTESQFPGTNHWKRKILSADGIPIVLHDHRDTTEIKGAVTIEDGVILRANVADLEFMDLLAVPRQNYSATRPERAVVHGTRCDFIAAVYPDRDDYQAIVLHATTQTGGLDEKHEVDVGGKIVWLSMKSQEAYKRVSDWLPEFLALEFDTAVALARTESRGDLDAERIQRPFSNLLDITHPGDPTAPLAFRLLCDAWKETNVSGNSELSGVPITAPDSLDQWLAPFDPQGNDDPARIDSVVTIMGDDATKAKVKDVLDAADADPKEAVLAFLNRADEAAAKEGDAR